MLMKISKNWHLFHFGRGRACVLIKRTVVMGNTEVMVGLNKGFIQHLFLFISHVRDQKREEDHQLLDFLCQHGVHVVIVHIINQLHFRGDGMADLHYIDAVGRAGGDFDKFAPDPVAGPFKLMALDGSHNIALNPTHPHSQS